MHLAPLFQLGFGSWESVAGRGGCTPPASERRKHLCRRHLDGPRIAGQTSVNPFGGACSSSSLSRGKKYYFPQIINM